jgi:hypothetical protein
VFGQENLTKKLAFSQEILIKTLLQWKKPSFKQGLPVVNKKRDSMLESAKFKGVNKEVSEQCCVDC